MYTILMPKRFSPRIVYTLLSFLIVIGGTLLAIQYAKGSYRITRQGFIADSGLLSANSFPNGAEVLVNGRLVTATDDTLYLEPGTYLVEIVKDGFAPWRKNLSIQQELVTQTNATLFPSAPSLTPLTFTGVRSISFSPDGQKILYYAASASAEVRNGLYLLELSNNPISFQRGARHLAAPTAGLNLETARYIWSPDSSELLVVADSGTALVSSTSATPTRQYLLSLDRKNDLNSMSDVGFRSRQILSEWEQDMYVRERQYLAKFPSEIVTMATTSAKNVYFSPDKNKLLYTAVSSVLIPEGLAPPIPSRNSQPQERLLIPGSIYVYDLEEDANFKVGEEAPRLTGAIDKQLLALDLFNRQALTLEASPSAFQRLQGSTSAQTAQLFNTYHSSVYNNTLQWFPNSTHLIYSTENQVHIKEYDGTNDTTVYFGPYSKNFVYPWPDGSKLMILTSFGSDTPDNLYAIELK